MRWERYTADILWARGDQDFLSNRYSRRHVIRFDGGVEMPGSSSPHVVPVPHVRSGGGRSRRSVRRRRSRAVTCSGSSRIAAKRKYCVDRYADSAVGVMGKNAAGKEYVAQVTLHPEVAFSGDRIPDAGRAATRSTIARTRNASSPIRC